MGSPLPQPRRRLVRPPREKQSPPPESDELSNLFRRAIAASPVLSALGWTVRRDGEGYSLEHKGEAMARVLPDGDALHIHVAGRAGWEERAACGSAREVVDLLASDGAGAVHGLGALDAMLRVHGVRRQEMCQADDDPGAWWYLDLAPAHGTASVPEVLYHAFGVPIPVIAEPRGWWRRFGRTAILDQRPGAALVGFASEAAQTGRQCLYAERNGAWGAYPVRPAEDARVDAAVAWLARRDWRPW